MSEVVVFAAGLLCASSATLALAVRELRRQYDAMAEKYPEMQRRGMISGKEAERRLFAQKREAAVLARQFVDAIAADLEEPRGQVSPNGLDVRPPQFEEAILHDILRAGNIPV